MKNKVEMFREIVDDMANLYAKKNENYGDSFGETYQKLGPISGITRLYDKLNRATSLVKGGDNHFESLEDTFLDMACYSIMNLIELRIKNEEAELLKAIEESKKKALGDSDEESL